MDSTSQIFCRSLINEYCYFPEDQSAITQLRMQLREKDLFCVYLFFW